MKNNVTSRDVAKEAGVSQSLVSLVLNAKPGKSIKPETRRRILDAARKLNYKINVNARNMKSRRAGAVGLLSAWDANSFVFPPAINGLQAVCAANNAGVVLCTGKKGASGRCDYVDYYLENRIDGLIYVSYVGVARDGVIATLEKHGIPFVCVIGARDIPGVSCADVSFVESGRMAVNHLVEMGYGSIAYLNGGNLANPVYAEKERYEGCAGAASALGARLDPINFFEIFNSDDKLEEGLEWLVEGHRYDAAVSTSFGCFSVLKAAARAGIKVPGELGVISLDNELYAPFLYPSLTTVDEPLFDIAVKAANILFEKINGFKGCEKVELMPRLSVRESTLRR